MAGVIGRAQPRITIRLAAIFESANAKLASGAIVVAEAHSEGGRLIALASENGGGKSE
jgi:hypothetical protein